MEIGQRLGIRTTALLVSMDSVLGQAVGNTLEVAEALDCLQGRGPRNVIDIVCTAGRFIIIVVVIRQNQISTEIRAVVLLSGDTNNYERNVFGVI